jgi:hypothetical protein
VDNVLDRTAYAALVGEETDALAPAEGELARLTRLSLVEVPVDNLDTILDCDWCLICPASGGRDEPPLAEAGATEPLGLLHTCHAK